MFVLPSLSVAFVAVLAEVAEGADVPPANVPGSQFDFSHRRAMALGKGGSLLRQRGLPPLAVVLLVAAVASVFLVFQCFKALQSNKEPNIYAVTTRRLAEGGSDPCDVGRQTEGRKVSQGLVS
ncbi:hypothetical protein EBH_0049650 [Eimeria brunetti]|uniref:Uncharacterized protein n=1 Tax=Eimeria brunetti TaxID=51314 RepID=U6LQ26_9EIME|nr:hypothetical protein EBH_0049650 [Eimeria brunetti]